ncbi:MAG TPA: Ig-like domain-containing protein, partial [Thermoanaerobaculia bacterium]|nr:Ig-like domain-containing protein [Thermoanaerobaculia bacterium]
MLRRLLIACSIAVSALSGAVLHAGEVARGELAIVGLGVEVDRAPVSAATGVPSSVQTIFGGRKNDDAPPAPGLSVLGELTGPGVDAPITLSAIPGRRFAIPALHTKGEYTLQNIRLVGASGEFLQQAMPSYAVINVTDALKTEVRVRQLTPEEMRERGILVDARNFDVYEYTFIFSVDQSEIEIPYPVIVDRQRGATIPFGIGAQSPPPLPRNGGRTRIVRGKPQVFDLGNVGDLPPEEEEKIREGKITMPRLPAALVMPTGFGVLHQFFAVILEVSNAADDGSSVKLDSITASLRAPLQMRVSKVMPAVAIGQPVPIKDEKTGATFLVAGARGTAEWTLEALKTGTHTVDIDVRATYQKPGQEDFPLGGKVSTTIVVSDPRFQITFSHPDTVRKDEQYTAYAFVTNLSEQAQHVVLDTSQIPPCSSGGALQNICRATAAGVTDDGKFELDLAPGEMKPVPYKLLSKVTGQIFAGAGSANDETLGVSMQLTMGVSTSGIPLSPATLLMPYYAQFLPTAFVEANLQLLGLGYSLAVAPLNKMTAAHPRVITDDVFTRAQEIARAGQRIFIARQQRDVDVAAEDRDALTHLSLDLLDNVERVELLPRMPLLAEWDELRRREDAGRRAGAAIARELERTARETPLQFVDDYASAASHRSPFLFAYAHGADVSGNARPYALSVGGRASGTIADVPAEAASGWVRTLPAAEVTKLAIGGEAGELALVGRWSEDYRVVVKPAASSFTLHLLYPDTADGALLRAAIAVSGATPGTPVWVDVARGVRNLTVQGANGSATASAVPQTPLRVLGAAQDLHLDTGGHIVMMLFNRPVTIAGGAKWRDRLALTINVPKAGYSSTRRNNPSDPDAELQIPFANLQDDGRMVGITFDKVLSRNASYEIAVDGVLDRVAGGAPFALGGIVPRIDNDRPGGILTGKVLRPDNTPAAGAFVTLHMPEVYDLVSKNGFESLVQADVTGADGQFMFEHVPRDPARSVYGHYDLAARVGQDTTGVSGAVRLPGEVHTVNLVFFGRGKAQGHLRYDDGTPIARQRVSATSPLWGEKFAATTDANGFYEMSVGVGPLTFYAHAGGGRVAYAANHLRVAGEVITQNLTIARNVAPGVGTVRLIVRRPDTNEPLNNATVIGSSNGRPIGGGRTDANGVYTFLNIPAGVISVALAHSDVYTGIELELLPDQTVEKIAFIDVSDTAVEFARIEGVVTRDDPAAPNDRTRDQPVPNAMVLLKEFALVKANADGTYVIENVPVALSGQRITVYDPVTTRHTAFAVPTLVANTVVRLPLRLTSTAPTATGTMRVRVFDAKGEPVSQYQVLSPGFPPFKLRSVAAGVYEAAGLAAPRSDGVVALPLGSDGPYGDQYATGTARVDFDGQVSVTDLRLPGMGTITVRIVVEQSCSTPPCYSQAFGRAALTYLAWDNFEQGFRPKTVEADADPITGIVTFQKVPARQKVILSTVRHPLGFASADAFLSYDGDAHAITLQLKDMGDVTGRVFAIDNLTPVSGANVRIVVSTASYSQQLTGPDGAFNFPAIAANHSFDVIAELSQDGIYRTGIASGKTPAGGGPVSDVRVIMREQSSIEGRVLDSEGRPVPLAHYWLRELAWPHRSIGTADQPLQADINGRFIISNVFTGPFRISAVSAQNQELRGHYQGTLIEEGDTSQRNVEVRIGAGGVGTVSVTVRDPLLGFEPVANAEVALHRSGHGTFDFTSTDENGVAYFEQVPAGSYKVAAYSKARVRGGASEWFNVVANETAAASVELDFRGSVSGYLTDPMSEPANARVAFQPITVQGGSTHDYTMRQTTGSDGTFEIVGLMEGPFKLYGYEIGTERMAFGPKDLFISRLVPEHRNIHLELEKWAKLTVKAYLPNDSGGPGELAPLVEVDVTHADGSYGRAYQGNSLTFEKMSQWRLYNVTVRELVGEGRSVTLKEHRFPPGAFEHEEVVVFGATGPVEVLVLDGGGNPVVDAKVTIAGSNRKFEIFTDPNGMISLPNVPFGAISARTVVGIVSAAASGTVVSRSQPLRLTLRLGSNVEVAGFVDAEAPLGAVSADTRVLLEVTSSILTQSLRLESRTDAQGRFSFVGIPVGNTSLKLTYYGPNELLGAVKHVSIPNGTTGTFTVPRVRVDSTPPRILTIDPPVNSTNVSPAASINVTFSEQLPAKYLTTQYFQLHSTDDGRQVNVQVQTSVRPDGTFLVRLTPPPPPAGQTFPLKSNVLYRFVVSGDIEDLTGHRLHASAGTSFTTVNYIEPAIVLVQPAPTEALGEGQSFRIRFNKAIDINSFNSGNGGIVTLDRLATYKGAVVAAVPLAKFLDPADPTTLVVSPEGVAIAESSFYRLTVAGVRDLNTPPSTMKETRIVEYFSFDRVTPTARIVSPVAEGEKLTSGVLYAATVFVSDDGTNEAGDVAYVDWLSEAGLSIERAKTKPYTFTFVAPATSTGTTFTLKASATDLSFNSSAVASFTWDVAPNDPPRDIVVTNTPTSAYPGKKLDTRVAFKDEGLAVTVALELRGTNVDGTPLTQILGSKKITRTATTVPFAEATFSWTLPLAVKHGNATVVATITDASNKNATGEAVVEVLADTAPPQLVSMLPKAESRYKFGSSGTYVIELQVKDAETGVARAAFTINGTQVFASTTGIVDAATGITTFRHTVSVPPRNADTRVTIVATAYDHRDNPVSETREVIYERIDDETLPVAAWITPLDGAALPSNEAGWLTTLRIKATDNVKVTSVRFESTALAAPVTLTAPKSGTTDIYEAKVALTMPNEPFVIRAIVADTEDDRSRDVELPITIDPVAVENTISGDIAISTLVASQYADKSVLIRSGAKVYIAVPLALKNLIVVDGATVSNPEETKLDLTIADRLFIDADSSFNLNEKGYVGGLRNSEGNRVINSTRIGRTANATTTGGAALAAGSHARIGGS